MDEALYQNYVSILKKELEKKNDDYSENDTMMKLLEDI